MATTFALVVGWSVERLATLLRGPRVEERLAEAPALAPVPPKKKLFKIGSRKSKLALIQSEWVMGELQKLHPTCTFELHTRETIGDKVLDVALSKIGTKNLFTRELEALLASGGVDLVVHSLKDLPTTLPEGMALGAITEREDPRDAVIFRADITGRYKSLADLPKGAYIGTSSLRRTAQLRRLFPHLHFESVRGNLNTRLRKLDESTDGGAEGERYAALVLAAAGVHRMEWQGRIGQYLDPNQCPYAVGQGSLGIECREGDRDTLALLQCMGHRASAFRCTAERAFMRELEGGCSVPIGVYSEVVHGNAIRMLGAVHSLDGTDSLLAEVSGPCSTIDEANAAGVSLAKLLIGKGAKAILDAIPRHDAPNVKPN